MKLIIEPTDGNALDPHAVKGSDNLSINAPFFDFRFLKENPLERAGVILEIEPDAKALLERELRFHMNPDAPNYRAVMRFENGFGIQAMIGGIATYSDIDKQLFEIDILKPNKSGALDYWTDNPFLDTQVGEMMCPESANELIERVRRYTGK